MLYTRTLMARAIRAIADKRRAADGGGGQPDGCCAEPPPQLPQLRRIRTTTFLAQGMLGDDGRLYYLETRPSPPPPEPAPKRACWRRAAAALSARSALQMHAVHVATAAALHLSALLSPPASLPDFHRGMGRTPAALLTLIYLLAALALAAARRAALALPRRREAAAAALQLATTAVNVAFMIRWRPEPLVSAASAARAALLLDALTPLLLSIFVPVSLRLQLPLTLAQQALMSPLAGHMAAAIEAGHPAGRQCAHRVWWALASGFGSLWGPTAALAAPPPEVVDVALLTARLTHLCRYIQALLGGALPLFLAHRAELRRRRRRRRVARRGAGD
jgi:hypothetical protein